MLYVWQRPPSDARFFARLLMVGVHVAVLATVWHIWVDDEEAMRVREVGELRAGEEDLGGARAEVHRDDERRGRGELGGLVHEHPGVGRVRPKGRDLLEGARSARDEAGGGQEHGAPDFTKSSSSCKGSLASLNISMEGRLYDMTERASRGVTSAHSRDQPAILSRGEALCSPSRGQTVIRDAVNAAAVNR